jgi:hypothetical protein
MVAKAMAMTKQAKQIHKADRRRYYDSSIWTAAQVAPIHSPARLHSLSSLRTRTARRGAQRYALGIHGGANTVSASSYKSSYTIWLEADPAQPAPVSFSLGSSDEYRTWTNEHRTARSKEELVAVLRQHIGSWVAIRGSSVVMSSNSPAEVVSFLREHNLRADSIFKVPKDARQEIPGEA